MKLKPIFALSSLVLAMGFSAHAQENLPAEKPETAVELNTSKTEEILIVGVRSDRVSQGATGLAMELVETSQ